MKIPLSKESVRKQMYVNSPFNLATSKDDEYRNDVDALLDSPLFDKVLDVIYNIVKSE